LRDLTREAEAKRAGVTYADLADRLNKHGMEETEGSIGAKLARGTFSVTFFLACLTVLGIEAMRVADL
jgi:virulence-associated protein VapD